MSIWEIEANGTNIKFLGLKRHFLAKADYSIERGCGKRLMSQEITELKYRDRPMWLHSYDMGRWFEPRMLSQNAGKLVQTK